MSRYLILLTVVVVIFLGVRAYWSYLLSAPSPKDTRTKKFVVFKGEKVGEIADNLQKEQLIRSARAFKLLAKQTGQEGKIQAGDFRLSPSMSLEQILKQLTVGVIDKWVTLIEGWRVEEMANRLNTELGVETEEFIRKGKSKEGHLFPDTYLIKPDTRIEDIISLLQNTFSERYNLQLREKIKKLGLTAEQGVILASIVEREARSDEVRRMVASILIKRFKMGMALQTDATVQYALGYQREERGWWKKNLTREDLTIDSPYNTYLHNGLPPGPISSPGLSSLQAVADADPLTPYLYYYHDSQGNSYYAKILEEHNQNVAAHP